MTSRETLKYYYNWLFRPHFAAGHVAEVKFQEICFSNQLIAERIDQSKSEFKKYMSEGRRIKRGDFMIRNRSNIEVEVKAFSIAHYNQEPCYRLSYEHLKLHEEMQNQSDSPVYFAIFQRTGRTVAANSLKMIPLDHLIGPNTRNGVTYHRERKCKYIPLRVMKNGIELLNQLKKV